MRVRLLQPPGLIPYQAGLQLMQNNPNTLILLEHEPVYTAGRREHDQSPRVVNADRGGQVTWHGPGQLVAYPCLDLRLLKPSLHWYVEGLERVMQRILADYGISTRPKTERGVWTANGDAKIGFVGIRNRGWLVSHGLALNVNNRLEPFQEIVPCGDPQARVTSMQAELGRTLDLAEIKARLIHHFEQTFNLTVE